MSRKSEIVRAGSTEARDKNVTGLREDTFRPLIIYYLEVLRMGHERYVPRKRHLKLGLSYEKAAVCAIGHIKQSQ